MFSYRKNHWSSFTDEQIKEFLERQFDSDTDLQDQTDDDESLEHDDFVNFVKVHILLLLYYLSIPNNHELDADWVSYH